MYHDYFSNFARRNCAFFSKAVPVHRVVRAVEFKMATGCKFLSLAASIDIYISGLPAPMIFDWRIALSIESRES